MGESCEGQASPFLPGGHVLLPPPCSVKLLLLAEVAVAKATGVAARATAGPGRAQMTSSGRECERQGAWVVPFTLSHVRGAPAPSQGPLPPVEGKWEGVPAGCRQSRPGHQGSSPRTESTSCGYPEEA